MNSYESNRSQNHQTHNYDQKRSKNGASLTARPATTCTGVTWKTLVLDAPQKKSQINRHNLRSSSMTSTRLAGKAYSWETDADMCSTLADYRKRRKNTSILRFLNNFPRPHTQSLYIGPVYFGEDRRFV